jgi:large subunit ribosomal protein L25
MEEVVLYAKPRKVIGKQVRALRREGLLPGVVYGHQISPIPVVLNLHDASRALMGVSSSQLVKVDVNGEQYPVFVVEKQRNPVTGVMIHVDFLNVSMTERIRINVSLEFKGVAPAVKNYNGVIVTSHEELEVECLPGDVPSHIEVDMSELKEIGDEIHVRDIPLPPNVVVLTDMGEMVVVVTPPAFEPEEEEVVAEEAEAPEPEVIERGKKEEEEF